MGRAENDLYEAIMADGGDIEIITPHVIKRVYPIIKQFGLREQVQKFNEMVKTKHYKDGAKAVIYQHGAAKQGVEAVEY